MQTKKFMVADIGLPDAGLHPHVMLAGDAECWRIFLPSDHVLQRRRIVTVAMVHDSRRGLLPQWTVLGCESASKVTLRTPYQHVAQFWGEEVAAKNNIPTPQSDMICSTEPAIIFPPEHFHATPHRTAEDKAEFANELVRFMEAGFRPESFSPILYNTLCGLFRFQPALSSESFADLHFSSAQRRLAFMRQIAMHTPVGEPDSTMSDVERIVRAWTVQTFLPRLQKTTQTAAAIKERTLLKELLIKHGMPTDLSLPG